MFSIASQSVFKSLDEQGSGEVAVKDILSRLTDAGLASDDPRLSSLAESLTRGGQASDGMIDVEGFSEAVNSGQSLLERSLRGELVIPQFADFAEHIQRLFEEARQNKAGETASYIPQLARVEPEQFAVAICTIDGQRLKLGDFDSKFTFQSTCKPMLYCGALEAMGEETVHRHVGREPSGLSFNELTLNKAGLPHNPMINAGAIMCSSLWHPTLPMADRFERFTDLIETLSGGIRPGFDNATFHSEKETADRNFALAHHMRERGAFPEDTDIFKTLDLFFSACSIEITVERFATIAATFANGGVCPSTGTRVFADSTVKNCLSLMGSCGLYDYSGEFAFRVGIPAKSGVSGAIFAVIPNVMGIAVWSPRLDSCGNSVRGVEFLTKLVETFNFHNYDSLVDSRKIDPRARRRTLEVNATFSAIHAASRGDIDELKRLVAYGHQLDRADYDGRTPLHLAAAEGHERAIRYLLAQGVAREPVDRWDNKPLDDARQNGHEAIIDLLEDSAAQGPEAANESRKATQTPSGKPRRKAA